MENWYEFLMHVRDNPSSRWHLERIRQGMFKDNVDAYVGLRLIEERRKNQNEDPVYELTPLAHRVLQDEITLDELIQQTRKGELP